jgi:hypothetical protein
MHWGCLPAAAVSLLLRFRASTGVERQQMRWVVAGATGAVAALLLALAAFPGVSYLLPESFTHIVDLGMMLPPIAVGVAVLRYRLWDLDRLVSRTVTYALITGLFILPYLVVVPAAAHLAGNGGNLAVAAVTLAAAALFQPLRRRVQARVDRRFNRRRHDAERIVDAFGRRLRDDLAIGTLSGELLGVVDTIMQPADASLWLRPPVRPTPQGVP